MGTSDAPTSLPRGPAAVANGSLRAWPRPTPALPLPPPRGSDAVEGEEEEGDGGGGLGGGGDDDHEDSDTASGRARHPQEAGAAAAAPAGPLGAVTGRLSQAAARLALPLPGTLLRSGPRWLRRSPPPRESTGGGWGRRPATPSGEETWAAPLPGAGGGGGGEPRGPVALPVIMHGRPRAGGQSPSSGGRRADSERACISPSADVPAVPRLG